MTNLMQRLANSAELERAAGGMIFLAPGYGDRILVSAETATRAADWYAAGVPDICDIVDLTGARRVLHREIVRYVSVNP